MKRKCLFIGTCILILSFALIQGCDGNSSSDSSNFAPTVSVSASDTNVIEGTQVTFTATAQDSDGDTLTYSWVINGTPSSGATGLSFSHTFEQFGSYAVSVTVSDGEESASASTTVTVTSAPAIVLSADNTNITEGTEVTFNASAQDADGDTLTYSWTIDGTVVNGATSASLNHTFPQYGTYTVSVSVSDGEHTDSDSIIITVTAVPVISLSADITTVDIGYTVTIDATVTDADSSSTTISWTQDSVTITGETSTQLVHSFSNPGNHTIEAIVSDGTNSVSDSVIITVNQFELAGLWVAENIDMSDGSSGGADGYEWLMNGINFTWLYTGPGYLGESSYGEIISNNTSGDYLISLVTDDDLVNDADLPFYCKIAYTYTAVDTVEMTIYENSDTPAAAEASTTVSWGPTIMTLDTTTPLMEITGTWYGTDEHGLIEYVIAGSQFGFERFDDTAPVGPGVGGGDIVSFDNDTNSAILLITRHTMDASQVGKYMRMEWSPADPSTVPGQSISVWFYDQCNTDIEAAAATNIMLAAHTVTSR